MVGIANHLTPECPGNSLCQMFPAKTLRQGDWSLTIAAPWGWGSNDRG